MSQIQNFAIYLLLFCLTFIPAKASETLTIITEEWPPYNYTENQKLTGFSSEIVKLIMEDLKIQNKILVLPGPRGIKYLDKNTRTMFFSFIQTPKRKPLYKWIGPFGEQSISFYKKNGSKLKIETIEDAKKVNSICARESGLVNTMLKSYGFKNLDVGVHAESIYLKAVNGRCDLAIGESPSGVAFWLKKLQLPVDALIQTSATLINSPLYIITTKDVPDAEIAKWQKSLDKIKNSKVYSDLVLKYLK